MYKTNLIKTPRIKKQYIDFFNKLVKESEEANSKGTATFLYGFDLDGLRCDEDGYIGMDDMYQSWNYRRAWVKNLAHIFCNGNFIWFDDNINEYFGYRIKDGQAYNLNIKVILKYKLEKKL